MLDRNAVLFVLLQFGSRFANSFLVTAARYELLETGSVANFAWAQVTTSTAKMVVSQLSGILTDNFALRHMYVASEACNLVVSFAMFYFRGGNTLFFANVGLGLIFAFSQPLTKSMPPAIIANPEDLAVLNGWDLTCDKVGRYLAPMAYAVLSSSAGFQTAVLMSCALYALLTLLRSQVRLIELPRQPQKQAAEGTPPGGLGRLVVSKLLALCRQVWDGMLSLRRDRILRLLILNTLVTNIFVYPLNSVLFPVLFKRVAEESPAVEESVAGDVLAAAMRLLGIKKKKAWMNYTALVSLGGVVGPFLSNALVYGLEVVSKGWRQSQLEIGISFGIAGQIFVSALLAAIVAGNKYLGAGMLVLLLVASWVVTIAVNNIFTTYFNSVSQLRLGRGERGRFIANIMTVFTLGNSMGTLLFGWALASDAREVQGSVRLLLCGLALKGLLLALLRREGDVTVAANGVPAAAAEKKAS